MPDYYEVSSVREDRKGEKRWTRLGVAFPFKEKDGFTVSLSAIPAPEDGEFKLVMTRPRPKEGQRQERQNRSQQPDDFDSPF